VGSNIDFIICRINLLESGFNNFVKFCSVSVFFYSLVMVICPVSCLLTLPYFKYHILVKYMHHKLLCYCDVYSQAFVAMSASCSIVNNFK